MLAVIVGIGSTLVLPVHHRLRRPAPTIDDALTIVLAALSLLGLGIFGPGIANGLVSGGPQLGAGAAVGTGLAAGGALVAAGAAGRRGRCAAAPLRLPEPPRPRAAARRRRRRFDRLQPRRRRPVGRVGRRVRTRRRCSRRGAAASSPLRARPPRAADSMKSSFSDGAKSAFAATGGTSTMGTIGGARPRLRRPRRLTGRPPGPSA